MMADSVETRPSWRRTARYGAEAGVTLALFYALIFTGYAAVRSSITLLATPDVDAGLLSTLLSTWLSLALPALVIAAILALPVAAIGALTALLLRALVTALGPARTPGRGMALGGALCAVLSLGLLRLLNSSLGLIWTPGIVETITFWLIIPLLFYIVAGGLAGREMARMLGRAPRGHVGSPEAASVSGG